MEVVAKKYKNAGVEKGKYIVIHGIESDSKPSMQSRGDTDSLPPVQVLAEIANGLCILVNKEFKPVLINPHEKEREIVEAEVGMMPVLCSSLPLDSLLLSSMTPDGVIATNAGAIQLANKHEKRSIALFGSELKGRLFVPNAEESKNRELDQV